jgi:hypothetical protein
MMDSRIWGINVETETNEPCPRCGNYLEIIEDVAYYDDDDGTSSGYCAACAGCGNAWSWCRTPDQALDAVNKLVTAETRIAAFEAENAALRAQLGEDIAKLKLLYADELTRLADEMADYATQTWQEGLSKCPHCGKILLPQSNK